MGLLDSALRVTARQSTAGASQLGVDPPVLGRETGFPLIHVVRGAAQAAGPSHSAGSTC